MIGIYSIECTETGWAYVGSSKRIAHRLADHTRALRRGRHGSVLLQRAWDKYGEDKFTVCILDVCSEPELLTREQFWIDNHPSRYNVSREAGRVTGWRATEEQRRAARDRATEMWSDPDKREEIVDAMRKSWASPALRERMSDAQRARDPQTYKSSGRKIRQTLSSPEKRAERSQNRRDDWKDPVKRARILEGRRLARLRRLGLPDTLDEEQCLHRPCDTDVAQID